MADDVRHTVSTASPSPQELNVTVRLRRVQASLPSSQLSLCRIRSCALPSPDRPFYASPACVAGLFAADLSSIDRTTNGLASVGSCVNVGIVVTAARAWRGNCPAAQSVERRRSAGHHRSAAVCTSLQMLLLARSATDECPMGYNCLLQSGVISPPITLSAGAAREPPQRDEGVQWLRAAPSPRS